MSNPGQTSMSLHLWDRSSAMTCIADADGCLLSVNETWVQALGLRADEMIGKTIVDLVAPEERQRVEPFFGEQRGDGAISFEAKFLASDGSRRHIVFDAVLSAVDNRLFAVARDLTNEVEAAAQAARAEEMFRLVVDSVPQQICWKDMKGVYLGCNKRFAVAAGLSDPAQILGKVDDDVPWTDEAPPSRAYGRELMEPDPVGSRSVEPVMVPNGTKAWLDLAKLPLHNERGEVTGNLTILEDISQSWRYEQEIARFFSVSPEPLCVMSMTGQFLRLNRAWESTLGYSIEDLKSMRLPELVHTKDLVPMTEQLSRLKAGPTMLGLECRCRSRTGIYVWLAWSLLSIPEEGLIYAAVRNVDRRKRLERALMQRIEVKMLVGSISSHFVNVRFEQIDQGIENALAQLGETLGADRSCLFLLSEDGEYVHNTHEWCDQGVPSLREARMAIPRERRKWLMDKLASLESTHISRVADLPSEARFERQDFEQQGVKSLLRVPLVYAGEFIGSIGLDSVRNHKTWNRDARTLLQLVGELFAVTLERKRAEEALRENLKVIERQESAIQTLSTPIIRVWDGVLALPLVGSVDARRAAEITDKLLHAIVETKSRHAIIELTGVEDIDMSTAHHLLSMLRTIEFVGARGIVAGVRPAVAKTMASLDFELTRLSIQRDLQHALKLCMNDKPRVKPLAP